MNAIHSVQREKKVFKTKCVTSNSKQLLFSKQKIHHDSEILVKCVAVPHHLSLVKCICVVNLCCSLERWNRIKLPRNMREHSESNCFSFYFLFHIFRCVCVFFFRLARARNKANSWNNNIKMKWVGMQSGWYSLHLHREMYGKKVIKEDKQSKTAKWKEN